VIRWRQEVGDGEDSAESPQRGTAKRRATLVLSILKGETSAQAAARKHGRTVAEVEEWRDRFLLGAENALRAPQGGGGPEGRTDQEAQAEGRGARAGPGRPEGGEQRPPFFRRRRPTSETGEAASVGAPGVSDPCGGPQRRAPAGPRCAPPGSDQRTAGRPDRRPDSVPSDLRLSAALGAVALSGGGPHDPEDTSIASARSSAG